MISIFGVSLEVYIINFVIGVILYFLFRWLFRKLQINEKLSKILTWVGVIILSPTIYFFLIYSFIYSVSYYPTSEFSVGKWNKNPEYRYEMSQNIIESEILIGKTKSEILELLGSEPYKYNEDHWAYSLGFLPGIANIDSDVLDIYFENNIVDKVCQHKT